MYDRAQWPMRAKVDPLQGLNAELAREEVTTDEH